MQHPTAMIRTLILTALAGFIMAGDAAAQFCAEQSITWTDGTARHTTVIEGRIRDGCPMMRQSIEQAGTSALEAIGPDCDCDLVIDGEEARFSAPMAVVAGRMLDVCQQNRASARVRTAESAGQSAASAN